MWKRLLFFLVALMSAFALVTAQEDLTFTEVNATTLLLPGELGSYTLLLSNTDARELQVQVQAEQYAGLPSSNFEYVFVDPEYVVLSGYESAEVTVTIKLKDDALRQKRYETYVTAQALNVDDVSARYDLEVFALPPTSPIGITVSETTERVGPGSQFSVKLHLVNNVPQDLSNIDVYFTSDLFEDKQTIELFEDQEKDLEFAATIPRAAASDEYVFAVRVYYDDALQTSETGTFTVDENLDISQNVVTTTGFLWRKETTTITNNGNVVVSDIISDEPGLVEGWFTGYSLEPSYDDELGRATWSYTIAPGEKFVLAVIVDYRPFAIGIIVVIILGLIGYYLFIKRVHLRKEVLKLKYGLEGVSDFRVLLHLTNNTNKTIKDVTVVDTIPRILQPKMKFGTLHPSGVDRGDKGVRIMWKIPELVPREERVISYDVEAHFKVLGRISLPRAMAKYKNQAGRVVSTGSGSASFLSGMAAHEEKKK